MGGKIATLQLVNMEKYNYLTVDFFKKLLQFWEFPLFFSVVVCGSDTEETSRYFFFGDDLPGSGMASCRIVYYSYTVCSAVSLFVFVLTITLYACTPTHQRYFELCRDLFYKKRESNVAYLLFWCYQILLLVAKHLFFFIWTETDWKVNGK